MNYTRCMREMATCSNELLKPRRAETIFQQEFRVKNQALSPNMIRWLWLPVYSSHGELVTLNSSQKWTRHKSELVTVKSSHGKLVTGAQKRDSELGHVWRVSSPCDEFTGTLDYHTPPLEIFLLMRYKGERN